jgi:glycosyltransferase involved in cell wall biosynthesis
LGVDERVFTPEKNTKKNIDILYIGSKEPLDGYPLVAKAAKLIKRSPNIVTLFSEDRWITNEIEMRDLYRKTKLVVCTAHNEPFGLVPIESMACGTPVIAVNEGGYPETVIPNISGILVPRDAHILAKKIEWLLQHPLELSKLGVQARKFIVQSWTWKRSVQQLEALLQTCAKISP